MIPRLRQVRRSRGLSLQQVADRCRPATTPQTIGRLETGSRTLSMSWLNRIAEALEVEPFDLVVPPDQAQAGIVAILGPDGAYRPRREEAALGPRTGEQGLAIRVESGIGEYRTGDEIWLNRLDPEDFTAALNRDVLIPRSQDRFLFGRLIGREAGRLQLLPLGPGQRQVIVSDPEWIAVAATLIRSL